MASNNGELSEKSFACKEVAWKIENFWTLPSAVNYHLDCPSFLLANATWCLRLFPNGQEDDNSRGHINLFVLRVASPVSGHRVRLKFALRTRRGDEYRIYSGKCTMDHMIDGHGVSCYLLRSKIAAESELLVPDGALTVVCEIQARKLEISKGVHELQSDYQDLLQSAKDSDVSLKVAGKEFQAHKCILSARSKVFSSMFKHDTKEKASGVVVIDDLDSETFPDFLQHMYAGRVEALSDENVFSLYVAADKYDAPGLMSECRNYMKRALSVDTFCDVMTLALMHGEKELLQLAVDFFSRNLTQITAAAKWQEFLENHNAEANELIAKALAPGRRE